MLLPPFFLFVYLALITSANTKPSRSTTSPTDMSMGEAERLSAIVDGWGQLANTYANGIQHAG
ncbi:MAG: hypothetical protein AAF438_16435, partial [Pseudomonadota bacterium]